MLNLNAYNSTAYNLRTENNFFRKSQVSKSCFGQSPNLSVGWLSDRPASSLSRESSLTVQTGLHDMQERTLLVKITEVIESIQQQNYHFCPYLHTKILVLNQYQCTHFSKIHKQQYVIHTIVDVIFFTLYIVTINLLICGRGVFVILANDDALSLLIHHTLVCECR